VFRRSHPFCGGVLENCRIGVSGSNGLMQSPGDGDSFGRDPPHVTPSRALGRFECSSQWRAGTNKMVRRIAVADIRAPPANRSKIGFRPMGIATTKYAVVSAMLCAFWVYVLLPLFSPWTFAPSGDFSHGRAEVCACWNLEIRHPKGEGGAHGGNDSKGWRTRRLLR
jgi:hypothetical protein